MRWRWAMRLRAITPCSLPCPVPPVCASSPSCPSIHPPRSLRQSVRTIPEGWGQGSTHGWFPLDESKKAPTFDVNDTLQPFPGVSWFRPGTPCLPCSALSCRVVSLSSALFMAKGGLFMHVPAACYGNAPAPWEWEPFRAAPPASRPGHAGPMTNTVQAKLLFLSRNDTRLSPKCA